MNHHDGMQRTKAIENLAQHYNIVRYDVIKNAVYKDEHLTKAFQQEKHDIASQLLKEYAKRN